MKIIYQIIIYSIFTSLNVYAQNQNNNIEKGNIAKTTLYIELLGNGIYYSINVDKILVITKNQKCHGRIGFSYLGDRYLLPLSYTFNFGKNNAHFEIGSGITPGWMNINEDDQKIRGPIIYFIPLIIGYRHQKPKGGFMFNVRLMPLVVSNDYRGYLFGLGIGYTIKK